MSEVIAVATKDPTDVLDFGFDWSPWLTEAGADTIATSTWTIPTGITMDSDTEDTTTTTVWLSGGVHGTDYDLVNKVVTAGGRTRELGYRIRVRSQG